MAGEDDAKRLRLAVSRGELVKNIDSLIYTAVLPSISSLEIALHSVGASLTDVVSLSVYVFVNEVNKVDSAVERARPKVLAALPIVKDGVRPAISFVPVEKLLAQSDTASGFMVSAVAAVSPNEPVPSSTLSSIAKRTDGFQSIVCNGTITALTPDWKVRGTTIEEQATATLECVKQNLIDSGATDEQVVQVTIYLVENPQAGVECEKNKLVVERIFEDMLPGCAGKAALCWVPIRNLLLPELMLEVSAVALMPTAPLTGLAPSEASEQLPITFCRHNVMSPTLHKGSPSFSHSVRCDGSRNMLFLSEITGAGDHIEEQCRNLIGHLKQRMSDFGGSIKDVVSTTWYFAEISKMGEVAKIRTELFEGCRPQSGGIPVPPMEGGCKIKLSAIAVLPAQ